MTQCLVQPVPHLVRNHGRRNQQRVRMLQARAGVQPMIFEDRNVVHPRIEAQLVVTAACRYGESRRRAHRSAALYRANGLGCQMITS